MRRRPPLILRMFGIALLSFFLFFMVARPLKISIQGRSSFTLYMNRVVYVFRAPKTNDNVVISSNAQQAMMVGTIVAGPSDEIKTDGGVLFINDLPFGGGFPDLRGKYYNKTLDENEYLIMSLASRPDLLGLVYRENITGKLWALDI